MTFRAKLLIVLLIFFAVLVLLFLPFGRYRAMAAQSWEFRRTWKIESVSGDLQLRPGFYALWTANDKGTRIIRPTKFSCYNTGGFAYYDGCTKDHGPRGFRRMWYSVRWKYGIGVCPGTFCDWRWAYLDGYIYADGRITGEFHTEN